MTRTLTAATALLLLTTAAHANRPKFSVQGTFGFNGTVESETTGGASADSDLESDFGLMGTVEFQLSKEFRLGARLAYSGADIDAEGTDESAGDVTALDGGLWARFVFLPGRFEAFGAGGLGFSSLTFDPRAGESSDGTGYHFLAGLGASFPVAKGMRLIGGLYYVVHNAELESGGRTADVTLSRAQFAAGVMF